MQLVSTLGFLFIARIHARNVGDPTELRAESVNASPTEGDQGEDKRRGLVDESCSDVSGWYDADESDYDCDWCKSANSYCARYHGDGYANQGHTANSACCICGGGFSSFEVTVRIGGKWDDDADRLGVYEFDKLYNGAAAYKNGNYVVYYGGNNDGWQWTPSYDWFIPDNSSQLASLPTAQDFVKAMQFQLATDEVPTFPSFEVTAGNNDPDLFGVYEFDRLYNGAAAYKNGNYFIFYQGNNKGWQWVTAYSMRAGNGPQLASVPTAQDFVNYRQFELPPSCFPTVITLPEDGNYSPVYPVATTGFEDPVGFDDNCLKGLASGVVFFYDAKSSGRTVLEFSQLIQAVDNVVVTATVFNDVLGPSEACATLSSLAECRVYDDFFGALTNNHYLQLPHSTTDKWIIVYESTDGVQVRAMNAPWFRGKSDPFDETAGEVWAGLSLH
jgi:hypothetical protein